MTFLDLAPELQDQLKDKFTAAVRFSAAQGDEDKINDAMLFKLGSPVVHDGLAKLEGYVLAPVSAWFDFVAAPYADDSEKCVQLAENALLSA